MQTQQHQMQQQVTVGQPQSPGFVTTMPGAIPHNQHTQVVSQTVVSTSAAGRTSGMKSAIPDLPFALAVVYGVLNFIFPGLGTILAGISVLFCGNGNQSSSDRFNAFCINILVGLLQAALTPFFIGWIWSIIWGIAIMTNSGTSVQEIQPPISTVTVSTNQQSLPQPSYQQVPIFQQPMTTPFQPQPIQHPHSSPINAWS